MAILPGKRVRDNSIFGTLTSPISSVTGTISSSELADLSAISGDHAIVTLDPFRQAGDPEIIMITSHTASATSASVQRGMYGTTARAHAAGTQWAHAATVEDFPDVVTSTTLPSDQFEGQLVYQTDTDSYRYFDGVSWRALGAGSPSTLAYAQVVANQTLTVAATYQDIVGLSVSVTVPEGRRLRLTAKGGLFNATAGTNQTGAISIFEGATQLGIAFQPGNFEPSGTFGDGATGQGSVVITPTAGTHTYKIAAFMAVGTTSLFLASATSPGYILVEDITGTETPFAGNSVPVGQLAYAQVTANQGSIVGSNVDLTGLTVNVTVPAGRVLRISSRTYWTSSTGDGDVFSAIFEGATQLQESREQIASTAIPTVTEPTVIISPSAGSHTYKLVARRIVGTGTLTNNGNANFPSYIMVEDITPTPSTATGAPSSTLAYTENLALSQAVVGASTADLTNLSATFTVPAGRRIKVTGHVYAQATAGAPTAPFMQIMEGATRLQIAQHYAGVAPDVNGSLECTAIVSPTAGTHTYKLQGGADAGDTNTFVSGSNFPAFILVEDITGSVWPAGSQVTNGIFASEAWIDYVPTLISSGVTPTLGTGPIIGGRYNKRGRTVTGWASIKFGTGATAGTGSYIVTLPVAWATFTGNQFILGSGYIFDNSVGDGSTVVVYAQGASSNQCLMVTNDIVGLVVAATAPWTWADNDEIRINFTYESAS